MTLAGAHILLDVVLAGQCQGQFGNKAIHFFFTGMVSSFYCRPEQSLFDRDLILRTSAKKKMVSFKSSWYFCCSLWSKFFFFSNWRKVLELFALNQVSRFTILWFQMDTLELQVLVIALPLLLRKLLLKFHSIPVSKTSFGHFCRKKEDSWTKVKVTTGSWNLRFMHSLYPYPYLLHYNLFHFTI